jgi:hypothetical protein
MATIDEFALKNIGLWWRYGISRHCDEWKYIIIGRIFESEIILIPPYWRFPKVVPMGAIVIRTRYDESTESAEVVTSATLVRKKHAGKICACARDHFLHFRTGPLPVTYGQVRWRHFRSRDWCHFRSCAMVRSPSNMTWAVPIYTTMGTLKRHKCC